jgi:hypothetical protein
MDANPRLVWVIAGGDADPAAEVPKAGALVLEQRYVDDAVGALGRSTQP